MSWRVGASLGVPQVVRFMFMRRRRWTSIERFAIFQNLLLIPAVLKRLYSLLFDSIDHVR